MNTRTGEVVLQLDRTLVSSLSYTDSDISGNWNYYGKQASIPLEVIRSASLYGAQALGLDDEIGSVEVGKKADLILISHNPLENLKVLYGTGTIKLDDQNEIRRVGGVDYTIKDGVIYNAKELLEDVRQMVDKAKEEEGFKLNQPGLDEYFRRFEEGNK